MRFLCQWKTCVDNSGEISCQWKTCDQQIGSTVVENAMLFSALAVDNINVLGKNLYRLINSLEK